MVATPGRALAECLALRRTVVPNVREAMGADWADYVRKGGVLFYLSWDETGYGAKDCIIQLTGRIFYNLGLGLKTISFCRGVAERWFFYIIPKPTTQNSGRSRERAFDGIEPEHVFLRSAIFPIDVEILWKSSPPFFFFLSFFKPLYKMYCNKVPILCTFFLLLHTIDQLPLANRECGLPRGINLP